MGHKNTSDYCREETLGMRRGERISRSCQCHLTLTFALLHVHRRFPFFLMYLLTCYNDCFPALPRVPFSTRDFSKASKARKR